MKISELPLAQSVSTSDDVPIDRSGVTYRVKYEALRGPQGPQGATGATGATGPAGPGLPSGGTTGQVIRKASGTNYDTAWESVDSTPTASSGHLVASGGVKAALDDKLDTANVYNGLDKTASGYALDARQGKALNDALAGKQATLTFDSTPTASSTNPVTSGGVKTALDAKQNTLTFDSVPTANSTNPVTSGGVKAALDNKAPVIINTVSGSVASFSDGADDLPVQDLKIGIEPVQSGSGDPSPSNVRPISGWTGAQVTRTGKNVSYLQNDSNPDKASFSYTSQTDSFISGTKTGTGGKFFAKFYARVKESIEYILSYDSYKINDTEGTVNVYLYSNDLWGSQITNFNINSATKEYTWTSPVTGTIAIGVYAGNNVTNAVLSLSKFMIRLSTVAAYEPYAGDTYSVSWQSEAGTVYGGTLDVTTGLLTVDRANIASYAGETLPGKWISDRDVYAAGTNPTTGAQVVYELATPVTYQLTPNEVKTLLGDNCIWADCGPTVLKCRADSGLFIAKETAAIRNCIAPTEDGATASQAYAQGKYFFRGGNFCKAKTSIASGASFTLNTNYEITTVAAELYALQ